MAGKGDHNESEETLDGRQGCRAGVRGAAVRGDLHPDDREIRSRQGTAARHEPLFQPSPRGEGAEPERGG